MHTEGTLSKWNESKGCGYITPLRGGPDIIVHISAFANDGQPPVLRERLRFTIEIDASGKKRAVNVQRPRSKQHAAVQRPTTSRLNIGAILAATALLAAISFYGYTGLFTQGAETSATSPSTTAAPAITFQCDGRTQCSQMTSCEEAHFFLHHCPNVHMDDDGDGLPCEQQWCGR